MLLSFFKLTKIYQNYCHTELTQKGRNLQRSFAVTLKGKPSKSPTPELKPKSSADEKKKEGRLA